MIVTIDGPAGTGKSTVSKMLAEVLGFQALDTGAMYRAVTYLAIQSDIMFDDTQAFRKLLDTIQIDFQNNEIIVNGKNLAKEIRSAEVTKAVSPVSAIPEVRRAMTEQQRKIASRGDFVVEGRDMGSVVFPEAEFKFYLDADPEERAKRRLKELVAKGLIQRETPEDLQDILADIKRRDQYDSSRSMSPLCVPEDATVIDTTRLTVADVVEQMRKYVQSPSVNTE